ncbi:hypothetical protein M0804_013517 [Polistes exclamans]|nr:hypothetical protein M0804_013517 [Polistes exclamans]
MCTSACLPLDKWKSNSPNRTCTSLSQSDSSPVHSCDDSTTKILVVFKAKILMQRLLLEKVGWDDYPTPDIIHDWSHFRQHLSQLSVIETPRWINLSSKATSIQIHGFSDASQLAIAAVVYLRVSYADSSSVVSLQQLVTFLWSDSSVTLALVKNNPMRWREFVGNRVAAIHESVPHAHYRFISGKLNPADCASRGLSAS